MTPEYPVLYLARIVLETTTALSISSGSREAAFDTLLVRDANGLPVIPGTSLAGVLRSLFTDAPDTPDCETVFGYAEGNEGWPSRVHVSWGAIHDAQDKPVERRLLGEDAKCLAKDPLLRSVTQESPVTRDHIRIHHRGAGDDKGKFDRTALHSGHRFSVEIMFWSKGDHCSEAVRDRDTWKTLLNLFAHPGFRLGGHTRRGLGAVKVVRAHQARFVLYDADDYLRYCALPNSLVDTGGLAETPIGALNQDWITCALDLEPDEGWRFGQGNIPLFQEGKEADLLPVTESRVYWNNGRGELGPPRILIPASGIKGPLAHRVAFHFDCLTENWTTAERCRLDRDSGEAPPLHPAVAAMFGYAKRKGKNASTDPQQPATDAAENEQDRGRAGGLYLDDVYLDRGLAPDREIHRQWHNGIDRFTGGVRRHVLYGEELIWRNTLRLTLRVDPRFIELERVPGNIQTCKDALRLALEDLCQGRLAIGGGSGKGHGYCKGSLEWSDDGKWIGGEQ